MIAHMTPATRHSDLLAERLRTVRLLAVATPLDVARTVSLADALHEGGIGGMEITFRAGGAEEAIRAVKDAVPEMFVAAGTLLTPEQVEQAHRSGADAGVAPGCNLDVVSAAAALDFPFAPGVATPTDIEQALSLGCRCLKFFPAAPIGGLAYLAAIAAPYQHLGLTYFPLGGIDEGRAEEYLALPYVAAVGGSFLAPDAFVRKESWDEITGISRQAIARLHLA